MTFWQKLKPFPNPNLSASFMYFFHIIYYAFLSCCHSFYFPFSLHLKFLVFFLLVELLYLLFLVSELMFKLLLTLNLLSRFLYRTSYLELQQKYKHITDHAVSRPLTGTCGWGIRWRDRARYSCLLWAIVSRLCSGQPVQSLTFASQFFLWSLRHQLPSRVY